jgi:hypothetical protein
MFFGRKSSTTLGERGMGIVYKAATRGSRRRLSQGAHGIDHRSGARRLLAAPGLTQQRQCFGERTP